MSVVPSPAVRLERDGAFLCAWHSYTVRLRCLPRCSRGRSGRVRGARRSPSSFSRFTGNAAGAVGLQDPQSGERTGADTCAHCADPSRRSTTARCRSVGVRGGSVCCSACCGMTCVAVVVPPSAGRVERLSAWPEDADDHRGQEVDRGGRVSHGSQGVRVQRRLHRRAPSAARNRERCLRPAQFDHHGRAVG